MTIEHFSTFSIMSAIGLVVGNGTLSPSWQIAVTCANGRVARFAPKLLSGDVIASRVGSNAPAPDWAPGVFYSENTIVEVWRADTHQLRRRATFAFSITGATPARPRQPGFGSCRPTCGLGYRFRYRTAQRFVSKQQFFASAPRGNRLGCGDRAVRHGLRACHARNARRPRAVSVYRWGRLPGGFDIDVDA